jgi:WD40 repeat protein
MVMIAHSLTLFVCLAGILPPSVWLESKAREVSTGAQPENRKGTDCYGDPLPNGAIARLGTRRLYHPDVFGLCFSADGKILASVGGAGTVRCWETETGREIREFKSTSYPGYAPETLPLALSADGKFLAWVGGDQSLRFCEIATGKELYRIPGFRGLTAKIVFSQNGRYLSGVTGDGSIGLWEALTGRPVHRYKGFRWIYSLGTSAKNKTISAIGSEKHNVEQKTLSVWDIAAGKQQPLRSTEISAYCCAFTPDGSLLVLSKRDEALHFCDPVTANELRGGHGQAGEPLVFSFSPGGRLLATSTYGGMIKVWETHTGKLLHEHRVQTIDLLPVALSPDGMHLAWAGASDQAIHLWDLAKGRENLVFTGNRNGPLSVAFANDSRTAITLGTEWRRPFVVRGSVVMHQLVQWALRQWDADSGRELSARQVDPGLEAARSALSPNGGLVASVTNKGTLRVWDMAAAGKLLHSWQIPTITTVSRWDNQVEKILYPAIGNICFSADGKSVVAAGSEKMVYQWEVATGRVRSLPVPEGAQGCILSPDNKTLAVSYGNGGHGRVVLLDATTGQALHRVPEVKDRVLCFAFSPDCRTLAAAEGNRIHLWEVASGQERARFTKSLADLVLWVSFSPDGEIVASGGGRAHATVELWRAVTGEKFSRHVGDLSAVTSLAFSPNGKRLASAGDDNTVLIWDVAGSSVAKSPPAVHLSNQELDRLWAQLASVDAPAAYRAIAALKRGRRQAVPFLKSQLQRAPKPDMSRLGRLVADLDSDRFAAREEAMAELEKYGSLAETALREALARRPSPEMRHRVEQLLEKVKAPPPSWLRNVRAVETLERIGDAQARQTLQGLAQEKPETGLTLEAKASLERLVGRPAIGH